MGNVLKPAEKNQRNIVIAAVMASDRVPVNQEISVVNRCYLTNNDIAVCLQAKLSIRKEEKKIK